MCTDHGDWVSGFPFLADGEGDDGRPVAGQVVLSAGCDGLGPGVLLEDLFEAGGFEELDGGGDGVECCCFVSI